MVKGIGPVPVYAKKLVEKFGAVDIPCQAVRIGLHFINGTSPKAL